MAKYLLPNGMTFVDSESNLKIQIDGLTVTGFAAVGGGSNLVLNLLLYHNAEHSKYRLEKDSNR